MNIIRKYSALFIPAAIAAVAVLLFCLQASTADWLQWGGTCSKNMVADEKGLPVSFVPGKKDTLYVVTHNGWIWAVRS